MKTNDMSGFHNLTYLMFDEKTVLGKGNGFF